MTTGTRHALLTLTITLLLLTTSLPTIMPSTHARPTALDTLPNKQKLTIPFNTTLTNTSNQPIDIRVTFTTPAWAINETHHSIRIGYDDGTGNLQELDSQLYDLQHTDDTHITAASIVFITPPDATPTATYYLLSDTKETPPPDYTTHITIEDTHYFYEPIPGQTIDFDYYGIRQDGNVIYTVVQKGQLLGNPIALAAIKFKPNSTTVETYNLDQLSNFDYRYGVPGDIDYTGTAFATTIQKTIMVTGNLMARVRLQCTSPDGAITSDDIYTYYYSPTTLKRIEVDAYHTINKAITIPDPSLQDGEYAGIVSIKARSASIQKMNVGDILPDLSVYTQDGTIQDYTVPTNPQSTQMEAVLTPQDDVNLGTQAWVSLQDPTTSKIHSIIFSTTTGITNGSEDGLQVRAWTKQNVKLPGLEADSGTLAVTRRAYQNGNHLTTIDQGRTYHYKSEFITIEHGDTTRISQESNAYQSLITTVPITRGNTTQPQNATTTRYNLTAFVYLARSVPLGSLLSAALGKNISYIYSELYQQETFRSSGTVGRLALGPIALNFTGTNLIQKIKMILGIFDFKNSSFTKKIRYPNLDPGTYVVKIYRENPRHAKEHQYIGVAVVNLTKDTVLRIRCRPQGTIAINISDQANIGVQNARCILTLDNTTISEITTDINGTASLVAPCYSRKPYNLSVYYEGFRVGSQTVKLTGLRRFITLKTSYSIDRYILSLTIKDTWGFPPAVNLNPTLSSTDMTTATTLRALSNQTGSYQFNDLPPAAYRLSLGYKSFKLEDNITITKDETQTLRFPAEFILNLTLYDSYAGPLSSGTIIFKRNETTKSTNIKEDGTAAMSLPPGDYTMQIQENDATIAQQPVQIRGEKTLSLVTTQGSPFHLLLEILGIAIIISALLLFLWKRDLTPILKIVAIGLLIIALATPWWVLNGNTGTVSTTTNALVNPPQIVSLTQSTDATSGEISAVPAEVTLVLGLLSLLVIIAGILLLISIITSKRLRKTAMVFSTLSIITLLLTIVVFYYAFSQVTQVGVGSFMGSGSLDVTLPGTTTQASVPCSWGPGIGLYLLIVAFVVVILAFFGRWLAKKILKR